MDYMRFIHAICHGRCVFLKEKKVLRIKEKKGGGCIVADKVVDMSEEGHNRLFAYDEGNVHKINLWHITGESIASLCKSMAASHGKQKGGTRKRKPPKV